MRRKNARNEELMGTKLPLRLDIPGKGESCMFTVTNRTRALFRKGKVILHEEGSLSFFKHVASFLVRLLFVYESYNIYEHALDSPSVPCKVDNLTLRVITCPDELDIWGEGFNFSEYKEMLNRGAILFCAFVGKELAHATWVAKRRIGVYHYFYPFSMGYGHTACIGGTMTALKYRRKGIYTYVYSQIFQYLRGEGLSKAAIVISKNNIAPQRAQAKLGSSLRGEGHYLRLLFLVNFRWIKLKSMRVRLR